MNYTQQQIAAMIDHTVLKSDTTRTTLRRFCDEAIEHRFASVCINPANVPYVASQLQGTGVKTCTVVGFPLGATTTRTKAFEAHAAIEDGANEIDMVLNIGALKDREDATVLGDIAAVVDSCHPTATVKVIIESSMLTREEIIRACNAAVHAEADYVKTSTGFVPGGATISDVALITKTVAGRARVKASTGINDLDILLGLADAGATRMGTSKGIRILEEYAARNVA